MVIRLIIGLCVIFLCQCEQNARKKIAVIGAGIGGGSAAYFTQQFLEEAGIERAEIEIFEANDYIGGRLKHIEFHVIRCSLIEVYNILQYALTFRVPYATWKFQIPHGI